MIKSNLQKLWQWFVARKVHCYWCLGLGLLAACLFAKYLFTTQQVLSKEGTDTFSQLVYTYSLGFNELTKGHLVLWNPYVYGGQPFLGQFQSALLYPINWFLALWPIAMALNWLVFLHVWLLGIGMYCWGAWRGLRPLAAFVSACALMLSGPFFLHIYAGHLPNLCSMAWIPFVFLGIDGWLRRRHIGWILLAGTAAALQIYAGHPQYFYYTAIVAGIYSLAYLIDAPRKRSAIIGLVLIYPLAVLLSAAQLLPGLSAAAESVRSGGSTYEFAAMFGLPWENFLTLVTPWFFGNMNQVPYWGQCYLWEMQLYCGLAVLLLAVWGFACYARRERARLAIIMLLIVILALGAHTFFYWPLYQLLPGYNLFRGTSKFAFFLIMLVTLSAGYGVNQLLAGKQPGLWLSRLAWGLGALALLVGLLLATGTLSGSFSAWVTSLSTGPESYLPRNLLSQPAFQAAALRGAGNSMLLSAFWLLLSGTLIWALRRWRQALWGLLAVALLDLLMFACPTLVSFPLADTTYTNIAEALKKSPGDYRILNLFNPEANVGLRVEGLWGYDPFVLKRYAEFMFFSQGLNPNEASQNLQIKNNSPLLGWLRGRVALVPQGQGQVAVQNLQENILSRFLIVSNYQVLHNREAILSVLGNPTFNPRQLVILEQDPLLPPDPGNAQYQIRLLNFSTDHWTLEVLTNHSSILVMTDAYSKDWRVRALPGSVQTNYDLLPADYTLRAIPLAPGRHLLRIEYVPSGFHCGLLFSGLTTLILLCWLGWPPLRKQLGYFTLPE